MYEINGITYGGAPLKPVSVKKVKATDDYKLFLEFSTGEQKIYDATDLIKEDNIFKQLNDISLFKQAHIDYETVVWNDIINIAPEFLYDKSIEI
ncbi:MAG: DUF2442 domain-containing protein [Oscillospiraceae bacterium]|nr:DUF2442 domain-containing protein [Oscillospiraceae bacterium]